MKLRQFHDFVAVYEEGGFTKAAKRRHATQPGISISIASLEDEVGVSLFERDARGAKPTPAGRRFYEHAVRVLGEINDTVEDMRALAGNVTGVVTVGLPTSIFRGRFAQMVMGYRDRFPGVELHIIEAFSSETLTSMLVSHQIDFALVSQQSANALMTIEPFYSSRLALVSGVESSLPRLTPLAFDDLPPLNLVMPSKGSAYYSMLDDLIQLKGIRIHQSICIDGLFGMLEFMNLPDWTTILPVVAVCNDVREGGLNINLLSEPNVEIDYFLARASSAPLSHAATEFLACLRAELEFIDEILNTALSA